MSLLEKLLKLQRSTGASEAAAQTSALLIDLVKDPKERGQRRRDAAVLMAERGDVRDAAELLEQALVEDPQDEDALVALCGLADRLPKGFGLADKLARALEGLAPPWGPTRRPAAGARSCGSVTASWPRKKAPVTAIASFEQVVMLDPDQLPAREALATLYKDRPGYEDAAIENHRRLLAFDVTRADSLRALAAGYAARGQIDRARCCHEVLSVLGLATKDEEAFLEAHPSQDLKPDDPYASVVEDQDRRAHLALPEAMLMAEIFSCLWEGAPGLIGQRLEDFGVSARDKVSPMSDLDLGKIYGQVAKALGNRKTALYVRPDDGASEVNIVVQAPPALVVGPGLVDSAKSAEVRFQLGRGIELSRPEYILAAGVRPKQFTTLFGSVLRAFHPRHARRRATTGDAAAEQAQKLKKNVPYKVSKQLVELFGALGTTSWSSLRWRAVVHHVGNRTGLVLCGDLKTATSIVVRESGTPHQRQRAVRRRRASPGLELRAAPRAAALRAQRGPLPAAREGRHRDREDRVGVAAPRISGRSGVSCLVAPRGRRGAHLFLLRQPHLRASRGSGYRRRPGCGRDSARSGTFVSSRRASSVLMSFWNATSLRMSPSVSARRASAAVTILTSGLFTSAPRFGISATSMPPTHPVMPVGAPLDHE